MSMHNRDEQEPWHGATLGQYVLHRNGVALGDSKSLRNMMYRSFGAGSFGGFWQYWNPIWGYNLGKFIYSPLKRVLPRAFAVIVTFAISGAVHDLATMAVRRGPRVSVYTLVLSAWRWRRAWAIDPLRLLRTSLGSTGHHQSPLPCRLSGGGIARQTAARCPLARKDAQSRRLGVRNPTVSRYPMIQNSPMAATQVRASLVLATSGKRNAT